MQQNHGPLGETFLTHQKEPGSWDQIPNLCFAIGQCIWRMIQQLRDNQGNLEPLTCGQNEQKMERCQMQSSVTDAPLVREKPHRQPF